MGVVEFSGSAGDFAAEDGRVLRISVAGTILYGAVAPDQAPDAQTAEAMVLDAAGAALANGVAKAEWTFDDLTSPDCQHAVGRRLEQQLVSGLPEMVTARVLELHV